MADNRFRELTMPTIDLVRNTALQNAALQEGISKIGGSLTGYADAQYKQNTNDVLAQIMNAQNTGALSGMQQSINGQVANYGNGVDAMAIAKANADRQQALKDGEFQDYSRNLEKSKQLSLDEVGRQYAQYGKLTDLSVIPNPGMAIGVQKDVINSGQEQQRIDEANRNGVTNRNVAVANSNSSIESNNYNNQFTAAKTRQTNVETKAAEAKADDTKTTTWKDEAGNIITAKDSSNSSNVSPFKGVNSYDVTYQNKYPMANGKNISESTIGEVIDHGKNVVIPATRNAKGIGTSPFGKWQIVSSTLESAAPKVLGKDWKSQGFTPENQEKIAEYLFNSSKGGDLTAQWEGLKSIPNAGKRGFFKDKTWTEMKDVIAQAEGTLVRSGSNGQGALNNSNLTEEQLSSNPKYQKLSKLDNDKRTEAAARVNNLIAMNQGKSALQTNPMIRAAESVQANNDLIKNGYKPAPSDNSYTAFMNDSETKQKRKVYEFMKEEPYFKDMPDKDKNKYLDSINQSITDQRIPWANVDKIRGMGAELANSYSSSRAMTPETLDGIAGIVNEYANSNKIPYAQALKLVAPMYYDRLLKNAKTS